MDIAKFDDFQFVRAQHVIGKCANGFHTNPTQIALPYMHVLDPMIDIVALAFLATLPLVSASWLAN